MGVEPSRAVTIKIDGLKDTAYTHGCRAMVIPLRRGLSNVCPRCGRSV